MSISEHYDFDAVLDDARIGPEPSRYKLLMGGPCRRDINDHEGDSAFI